jgi:hypothetical protein
MTPTAEVLDQLRAAAAYQDLEWNVNAPGVRDLIERGIGPVAGAAQGLNPAVFMNNVPTPGSYTIDQEGFNVLTERNDVPGVTNAWPGYGGRIDQRVANVGVLTNIRLFVEGTLTVSGAGTVTSLYTFPYGLLKNVYLNANGGTALIRANGNDLRARRCRIYRQPDENIATAPNMDTTVATTKAAPFRPKGKSFPGTIANGTYNVFLVFDLPIVHDPSSLTGALFAQSDQNYLNYVIETALESDVFSVSGGSTAAFTGNVRAESTFFSIPTQNANNTRIVVLPNAVRWIHEFMATDNPFANKGEVQTPLPRNNGQLLALYSYTDNGGQAQISPAALEYIKWAYAQNQVPRNALPVQHLLEENQRLYDGLIEPGPIYWCLDFEAENWQRDGVYPRGLSELMSIIGVANSTTVNANAHVHTVQETLTTS